MNIKELMSPDVNLSSLQAKADELFAAIQTKQHSLKNAPEGRLRIAMREDKAYYYRVTDASPQGGNYLPQAEIKTISQLAQKEYDRTVLLELQRELKVLDHFLKAYHPERIHQIYSSTTPARKAYVKPLRFPDEEFAEQWLAVKYSGKPFPAEAASLLTSRGERVRSKSEIIIADTLARLNIPYRYEYPHELKVRGKRHLVTFHPDFTCLNAATRKEFIWEHFGLMDDSTYATEMTEKIALYADNGFFYGDGLLFTQETSEHPLNSTTVETIAKKFLKSE